MFRVWSLDSVFWFLWKCLLLLLLLSRFSRVRLCATPRQQPTRLCHPWDSPGKNTGVGCHFLLQCMNVKSESEVAQLRLTLSDPMDCSLPGSSIHGFSRQEYWSGVPLPSPLSTVTMIKNVFCPWQMSPGRMEGKIAYS